MTERMIKPDDVKDPEPGCDDVRPLAGGEPGCDDVHARGDGEPGCDDVHARGGVGGHFVAPHPK